jgi:hypothetical protein
MAWPGLKMACNLNGSSWVNGWVFFNGDFTTQSPIAFIASYFIEKNNIKKVIPL